MAKSTTRLTILTQANRAQQRAIKLSLILLALFVWALFFNIAERTQASGTITTEGNIRRVQHLDGGPIEAVHVEHGQWVHRGTPLVTLSSTELVTQLARLEERERTLVFQKYRLRSLAADKIILPPTQFIDDKRDTERLLAAQINAQQSERRVLETQIEQRENQLSSLQTRKQTTQQQIDLAREEVTMRKKLVAQGLESKISLINSQRDLSLQLGNFNELEADSVTTKNTIHEYQLRLEDLLSQQHQRVLSELVDVEAELAELAESKQGIENKLKELVVLAPVDGVIQSIKVDPASIVKAGETFIELVPAGDSLIVEAIIKPSERGYIKAGQQVLIKVDTYNFTQFGSVEGAISSVSATTFANEDGAAYYLAKVKLSKHYVGNDPVQHQLLPGMTVVADITTGEKTLAQYLLKPMATHFNDAFSER